MTTTNQSKPLNENERSLMAHVSMFGSAGYPVKKLGRGWTWDGFGVKGPPVVFITKGAAIENFELWRSEMRRRLGEESRARCLLEWSADMLAANGATPDEVAAARAAGR